MRDPYEVLGVTRNASHAEIKRAYRKLAKDYHPDRHPDDAKMAERFKDISVAYKVLGDEKVRKQFDNGEIDAQGNPAMPHGFRTHRGQAGQGAHPFEDFGFEFRRGGGDPFEQFSDLFSSFRGGARRQMRSRGEDRRYTIKVEFVDAILGAKKRLNLEGGKTLDVRIPSGIQDGQQIRLKGQGDPGIAGGGPGDAMIEVQIKAHASFRREGRNIHLELPVTLSEAVLGGKVTVPTVHGSVTVTVPAGSNSGTKLRLKGKGVPKSGSQAAGDQVVTLKIVLPDKPDPELTRLVEKWSKGRQYEVRGKLET